MMRGLIGSIVGRLTGGVLGVGRFEQHFATLDKAQPGLARQVSDYIEHGSNASVLSTLGTAQIKTAWTGQSWSYPRTTPLDGLIDQRAGAQMIRFGEVMALLHPAPSNSHWGAFGTPASPDWLRHAFSAHRDQLTKKPLCAIDLLAFVAAEGGAPGVAVLDMLFHPGPGVSYGTATAIDRFTGADRWLRDNAAQVIADAPKLDAPGRVELAHAIGRFGLADPFAALLVDFGVSGAKTVRGAATKALTAATPATLVAALAARHATAAPAMRADLVGLAVGALREAARDLLTGWREGETEQKPREALDRALAGIALADAPKADAAAEVGPWGRGYRALDGSTVALPAAAVPPPAMRIPDGVFDLLHPSIESFNSQLRALQAENRAEKHHWSRAWQFIDQRDFSRFRGAIEAIRPADTGPHRRQGVGMLMWNTGLIKADRSGVTAFFAHPAITLRHLVTLLRSEGYQTLFAIVGGTFEHAAAIALRSRITNSADFEAVAALWAEKGGKIPAEEYAAQSWGASLAALDTQLIWTHVADNFAVIDEALGLTPAIRQPPLHPANALDLLGTLPKVPHRYLLPLMTLATGTQKALRQQARALLSGAPGIDVAIAGLLGEGKQDMRAGAAEWLAARDARAQIPALRTALAKEKSDVARAALITALERLGDDVSDCFDPAALLKEAEAGLAKAGAKGLDWFPFDLLPALAWRDGGAIDPRIPRWWVVLANKLKQPGGNALLDLWLQRVAPADAKRFGLFVLRSWIEHDTHRASDAEANQYAQSQIAAALAQRQQSVQRYPQILNHSPLYADRDTVFAELKRIKLGEYYGSANDSKGMLALAGAAEGADAASAVRAYLKDHGQRVAQDKALLDALAANPAPAAIQVVLATANRFKARTVQEHAATLIAQIAERRGWTPEELADRTIPTAGLDERGEGELDCGGGRIYRLILDENDALVLLNSDGKPVKALPAARTEEEKPLVAEAKKQLATAHKELKQATTAQAERFYEAMCLERRWTADDWDRHLLRHPIVARLLRRLVWIGHATDGTAILFRPLDDGSLSDVEDGTVAIADLAEVQLAHGSLVNAETAAAWRAHLADYEVTAPFDQFDDALPTLDAEQAKGTEIADRTGWMIESFKLRGVATKLGFARGAAEDGGVFMTYERRYDGAGLVALIEFTGSPLPEENIPSALKGLSFARVRRGAWHGGAVPLKDVPPVLLAETWKTYHRIAAAGTGFDAAWEKKAGW